MIDEVSEWYKEFGLNTACRHAEYIKWYVDTSFAVHADFKSHTGVAMTMGKGAIMSMSQKQKLNTKSSTISELVGADDATTIMLWTKLFMEEQGYKIDENILYQDNKSAVGTRPSARDWTVTWRVVCDSTR